MGAQHIIIGANNTKIAAKTLHQPALILPGGSKSMRKVATGQMGAARTRICSSRGPLHICSTQGCRAVFNTLGILQGRGYNIALVTDGRMSGASGKVPSAIHLSPEALDGGVIAKLQDGDMLRVDAVSGTLDVLDDTVLDREAVTADLSANTHGTGREMFEIFRRFVGSAETGASVI